MAFLHWLSNSCTRGATAIEYGLIASLIAIAIIVGLTLIGTNLNGLFNYLGSKFVAP
jgi:pilus assembly protein Flp/PilA